jgi:hypothetical protein
MLKNDYYTAYLKNFKVAGELRHVSKIVPKNYQLSAWTGQRVTMTFVQQMIKNTKT